MKRKPESDCGAACRELSDRQHAFHLLYLGGEYIWKCYKLTAKKGQNPTKQNSEVRGSEIVNSRKFQEALRWHAYKQSVRYASTKERAVEILAATLEGSDPRRFGKVSAGGVEFLDWDEIPGELTRGVGAMSETVTKDGGSTKLTIRDPVPAAARLAKMLGWDQPEEHKLIVEDADEAEARLLEMLARRARAKAEAEE